MKKVTPLLCLLVVCCFHSPSAKAQGSSRFGLSLGASVFFGDLGGANSIGRPLFFDYDVNTTKPVIQLFYQYDFSGRISARLTGSYAALAGDDKLIQPKYEYAPEWYRWYRNLNFRSKIQEGALTINMNLLRFYPGSRKYSFTPYIFGGIGIFHFNPQGNNNGQWVDLRPLRTEGEGFPNTGVPEYSLIQPCFPVGVGLQFNAGPHYTIAIEYGNRFTRTDYIDDVSRTYVSQADFNSYFASDPATAALAWQMSVQSELLDPEGINAYITSPGQQRGDPTNKDEYIFTTILVAYHIGGPSAYYGSNFGKRQTQCMKNWRKRVK